MTRTIRILTLSMMFSTVLGGAASWAAEPAAIDKFVRARIAIGEMMTNYFSGGRAYGDGGRPSAEQMRAMGADINTKLSNLLEQYDLTIDDYRQQSADVFADKQAVDDFLNQHPDLKQRYEALPLGRMGHGRSGRGY